MTRKALVIEKSLPKSACWRGLAPPPLGETPFSKAVAYGGASKLLLHTQLLEGMRVAFPL
jgi:hypothetical protein